MTAATSRHNIKRETDLLILGDWVAQGASVLDLGCGRGILLEHLQRTKGVRAVGVDMDTGKVAGCIERGVSVLQGDVRKALATFRKEDVKFDWIVCSRTLEELENPGELLESALEVGTRLAVSFANYGHWRNRLHMLLTGKRARRKTYEEAGQRHAGLFKRAASPWYAAQPNNPVSVAAFEEFCRERSLTVHRRVFLAGDWQKPCRFLPNLFAGYAVYEVSKTKATV